MFSRRYLCKVGCRSNAPGDFDIEESRVKAYAKVLKCKELNVKSRSEYLVVMILY